MAAPLGIDLAQYRTQAKDLLRQLRAGHPDALDRLRRHHPKFTSNPQSGEPRLADAQLVIARESGFPSWPKFRQYMLFCVALRALDAGDVPRLDSLLAENPFLLKYRCRVGAWYESGYFAGALLINHIAANPFRQPLPANILEVAQVLLAHGASDWPPLPNFTIELLLTSRHASERGVAVALIDMLGATGRWRFDVRDPDLLAAPLLNHAPETASQLIRRGARIGVQHAAVLGRLDVVRRIVLEPVACKSDVGIAPLPDDPGLARQQLGRALLAACRFGWADIVDFLLSSGTETSACDASGQTALHLAVDGGHLEIVRQLLRHGAPLEFENHFGGTVLGQALWSAVNNPKPDHLAIIELLVSAGARIGPDWFTGVGRIDELLRRGGEGSRTAEPAPDSPTE